MSRKNTGTGGKKGKHSVKVFLGRFIKGITNLLGIHRLTRPGSVGSTRPGR